MKFRIFYHGRFHGYWEDITINDHHTGELLLDFSGRGKGFQKIGVNNSYALLLVEKLLESPNCPEVLKKQDPIRFISVEVLKPIDTK